MDTGAVNEDRAPCLRLRFIAGLLPLLAFGGCASPGPPRAPSLNLPEIVTTFAAERVGNQVALYWTTPAKTTDGLEVRGPMTAAVCRRTVVSPEQPCAAVLRIPVGTGAFNVVDPLPPQLLAGSAVAVEYRLQILNAGGHSAGDSVPALVAGGPAPASPQGLLVKASQEGAVLTWEGMDALDAVELHRVTVLSAQPTKKPAIGAKKVDIADAMLRVPPGNGALDRTVLMGERYTYTAQRVRTVTIGGHPLEVRSAVAGPVTLEMRDVFPPRVPTGLEAVAADHVVDLSWEPNTEADLAGYLVLRQETGPTEQLSTALVLQPSFQDKTAAPGHTYRYTVIAVDRMGNRSQASEPAQVSIRSNTN